MSLAAVELHSADEVLAHAREVNARIQASRVPVKPAINIEPIMAELSTVKSERDQYRALAVKLQAENVNLATRLDRFVKRLSNLQHDAVVAHEIEEAKPPLETNPIKRPKITIDQIIRAVARHYGKSVIDLLSHRRTIDLTLPRHVACYLCKELTLRSLPDIGRRIGGRDHTTVLHGHRKIEKLLPLMPSVQNAVNEIKQALVGSPSVSGENPRAISSN